MKYHQPIKHKKAFYTGKELHVKMPAWAHEFLYLYLDIPYLDQDVYVKCIEISLGDELVRTLQVVQTSYVYMIVR